MDRSSIVVTYDGDLDTLFENADKALMLMDAQDIKYDYHKHVLYASVPIGGNKTPFALHLMMVSSRQLQTSGLYHNSDLPIFSGKERAGIHRRIGDALPSDEE